jgi:hypothetical protein
MGTKTEKIKELQKNYDPKVAMTLITGDSFSAEELAEMKSIVALRSLEGLFSAEDVVSILKDAFTPEFLGEICRKLLIVKEN